jgi:nitroreductase
MTDYFEVLKTRRSIRDYEDKQVPIETIREIIRESCFAPSSGNGQPWSFIIINDKALIKRLSDETKKNTLFFIEKNPGAPFRKYEVTLRNKDFNVFYNAPCLVYIGGSKEVQSIQVDCALAASYFMFSAAARGLGTCWIGLGTNIQDAGLLERIGMDEDYRIVAPIIVGYPRGIPDIPERMGPQILKTVS